MFLWPFRYIFLRDFNEMMMYELSFSNVGKRRRRLALFEEFKRLVNHPKWVAFQSLHGADTGANKK